MNYTKRQDRLKNLLESASLDAFLMKKKQNISYLVGTKGEDAVLFFSRAKKALITDMRYKEEYASSARNCHIEIAKGNDAYMAIEDACRMNRSQRIGFEGRSF